MTAIFHITPQAEWQTAQLVGHYEAASLETEGFIHCSKAAQVTWVANQFYRGQQGLVLLEIDPARLTAKLQEDEIETGDRFPHVYGAINLDAVVRVIEFAPNSDGLFCAFEPHSTNSPSA
jgi:uncharacterized protein (DUF952 family)